MISLHKTVSIAAGFLLLSSLALHATTFEQNRRHWRQLVKDRSIQQSLLNSAGVPFEVKNWSGVDFFLEEYAQLTSEAWMKLGQRMHAFLPMISDSLTKNGLPAALRFLPVAESRLKPGISSPAGASGIWQIMKRTGRNCGLVINGQVDERLDPQKSTKAAIDLLKKLYAEFGDWTLVLAAYNCGQSKVRRAINQTGCADYWAIKHLLPSQTRKYIPAYLAAACATTLYMQQGRPAISTHPKVFVHKSRSNLSIDIFSETRAVFCWTDPMAMLRKEKLV